MFEILLSFIILLISIVILILCIPKLIKEIPQLKKEIRQRKKSKENQKYISKKLLYTIPTSLNSINLKCKLKQGLSMLIPNTLCQININDENIIIYAFDENKNIINLSYKNIISFNIFNDYNEQVISYRKFLGNNIYVNDERKENAYSICINIKYKSKNNEIIDILFSTDNIDELNEYNNAQISRYNIVEFVNNKINN